MSSNDNIPPTDLNPPTPPTTHRHLYKSKPGLPTTSKEARENRVSRSNEERKATRTALVNAKRFKFAELSDLSRQEELHPDTVKAVLDDFEKGIQSQDRLKRINSLKEFSKLLIEPEDLVMEFAKTKGMKILMECLLKTADSEEQLLACWCITNIAAAPVEFSESSLPSVPYLAAFLSGSNSDLQEQAAWAIGNLAAESSFHATLSKNGVLVPLLNLLASRNVNVVLTACFAVSMYIKGIPLSDVQRVNELFQNGLVEKLVNLVQDKEFGNNLEIISEVGWILSYLTSHDSILLGTFYNTPILPRIIEAVQTILATPTSSTTNLIPTPPPMVSQQKPSEHHYHSDVHVPQQLAIPLIRTLGNISSLQTVLPDLLASRQGVHAVLQGVNSSVRSIRKESLWCLSNLLAHPSFPLEEFKSEILTMLLSLLTDSPSSPEQQQQQQPVGSDIKKEALYSLMNILSRSPTTLSTAMETNATTPYGPFFTTLLTKTPNLLASQDHELIFLTMSYIDAVLCLVSRDVVDAILNTTLRVRILDTLEAIALRFVQGGEEAMEEEWDVGSVAKDLLEKLVQEGESMAE